MSPCGGPPQRHIGSSQWRNTLNSPTLLSNGSIVPICTVHVWRHALSAQSDSLGSAGVDVADRANGLNEMWSTSRRLDLSPQLVDELVKRPL